MEFIEAPIYSKLIHDYLNNEDIQPCNGSWRFTRSREILFPRAAASESYDGR